jgi:HPt (histidine-containing phosphotransfer) domain-containing protein
VPPPDVPIVDEAVLTELLASTGDDPTFLRELLDTYLAETPEQLDAITAAVAADDAALLVRPAHTLKSSSATLGAMGLSALARELEIVGRSGSLPPDVSEMLQSVSELWPSTVEELTAWFTGLES